MHQYTGFSRQLSVKAGGAGLAQLETALAANSPSQKLLCLSSPLAAAHEPTTLEEETGGFSDFRKQRRWPKALVGQIQDYS